MFVSGRQHSGNSVIVKIMMQAKGCLGFIGDNGYIEHLNQINAVRDPRARVGAALERMRFSENPELGEMVAEHLPRWIDDHPNADGLAIYLEAMDFCVRASGNRFWLQKATSYIFYADEILSVIPNAKIVYLVRNPYDLVNSRIRRDVAKKIRDDSYWSTALGWRKGVRLAEDLARRHPGRFLIVQYERLVSAPDEVLPDLFEFAGYEYRPQFADVPRINTSERPYDWKGEEARPRGLSGFRVNSYAKALTPAQIRAADLLLPSEVVARWYPDLPRVSESRGWLTTSKALATLAWHMALLFRAQLKRYPRGASRKWFLIDRSLRRLRA